MELVKKSRNSVELVGLAESALVHFEVGVVRTLQVKYSGASDRGHFEGVPSPSKKKKKRSNTLIPSTSEL